MTCFLMISLAKRKRLKRTRTSNTTFLSVPFGLRLAPDGSLLLPQVQVGPAGVGNVTAVAYNPDRNEYLYLNRGAQIWAQYLTADGASIGSRFAFDSGGPPDIAYSTGSQRYLIVFHDLAANPPQVRAVNIRGDSTSPSPVVFNVLVQSGASSPQVAYGARADKFLVVFGQESAGAARGTSSAVSSRAARSEAGSPSAGGGSKIREHPCWRQDLRRQPAGIVFWCSTRSGRVLEPIAPTSGRTMWIPTAR